MARVTVEDCVDKLPNRFELVMLAAQRARQIGSGAALTLDRNNDKNPVVALREIADENIQPDILKEELTRSHQRVMPHEDDSGDIDLMEGEEEWSAMASQSLKSDMYGDDDMPDDSDDDDEPSLEDLAGS